jgi:hypothetical protein
MGSFSTSTHHLAFASNYKKLEVRLNSNNSLVEEYSLTLSGYSTSLTVSGGNFVINVTSDFTDYTHGVDLDAGATMSFPSANRMGGIGVIDLRDINGAISIEWELDCTTFKMKYMDQTPAFWLNFSGSSCFSYTEL